MSKFTKQGVRDLNALPSKPRGITLPELPPEQFGPMAGKPHCILH